MNLVIFKIIPKEGVNSKKICDNKIIHLCNHDFEKDSIDITPPDKSENIMYCKICGYTK